jgi:hypothetical protein
LFAGLAAQAWAEGIFTCVDGKGRRLTSDRPIIECIDREQRELTPGGVVKRKIGPSLTADERAAAEEKARKEQEERNRLAEEKRRERALLTRYPDKGAHDKERTASLALVDGASATATKRIDELAEERRRLELEREFFRSDPSKLPLKLKRQIEENARHIDEQRRFILAQEEEKRRVNARFDEELVRLKGLWAQRAAPVNSTAPTVARP